MTRLYNPDAYAVYGITNGIAALIAGIGLCSLTLVLVEEKEPAQREALVRSMLMLLFSLSVFTLVAAGAVIMIPALRASIPLPLAGLLMVPLLVLTYGLRQVYVYLAMARGSFTPIALSQTIEPLCSRGGSLALGKLLGGEPLWILCSVACGHLSTVYTVWRHAYAALGQRLREPWLSLSGLRATLKRYRDFVLFSTASQQMFPLVSLFYQSIIAAFCSVAHSGHYILATSILVLPSNLIATASSSATYHHLSELVRENPAALMRHLRVLMGLYCLAAMCIFIPIHFWGEAIFNLVFSSTWQHSGTIASILSLSQIGFFVAIGVQPIFIVTRRMKLQFHIDLLFALPTMLLAAYSFRYLAFDTAVATLAMAWMVRHAVVLAACLWSAHHFMKRSVA